MRGDRDPKVGDGLKSIEQAIAAGRTWDAVIDTSGYVPRIVGASAELLKSAAKQYVFVSSISVYADGRPAGITEAAAVATMTDPSDENVGANYGALKALCEQAAEKAFPGRTTNVRPPPHHSASMVRAARRPTLSNTASGGRLTRQAQRASSTLRAKLPPRTAC